MKGQIKSLQHATKSRVLTLKELLTRLRLISQLKYGQQTESVYDRRNANGRQTHTQLTKNKGTEMQ